jgi:hypothetical protein
VKLKPDIQLQPFDGIEKPTGAPVLRWGKDDQIHHDTCMHWAQLRRMDPYSKMHARVRSIK